MKLDIVSEPFCILCLILFFTTIEVEAGSISGPTKVCKGMARYYAELLPGESVLLWTAVGGEIQGADDGIDVRIIWSGTGPASVTLRIEADGRNESLIWEPVTFFEGGAAMAVTPSVCSGGSVDLSITGAHNSITQWEISSDGSSWSAIPNSASNSYVYTNFLEASYFRATSTLCSPSLISSPVFVSLTVPTGGGNLSASGGGCGVYTGYLTLSDYGNGRVYEWERRLDGAGWEEFSVPNRDGSTQPISVAENSQFRALTSGNCGSRYSSVATVIVPPHTNPGTLTSTTSLVCFGASGTLTLQNSLGDISWWRNSDPAYNTWEQIPSENSSTLNFSNLKQSTTYKAVLASQGCPQRESNQLLVTVNPLPIEGTISTDVSNICLGQSITISSGGGVGTPNYWASTNGGQSWNVFAQAYAGEASFQFTPTEAGTYRFHLRNQTVCGFCWDIGNCPTYPYVDVVVNPIPTVPTLSNTTVCGSGTIIGSLPANATTLNWYTAPSGGQAMASTTSPSATSTTTFYTSGYNTATTCESTRTPVTLTVNPLPEDGQITTDVTSICLGGTITISSGGGVGTPNYWASTNGGQSWNVFAQAYAGEASFQFTPTEAGTYRFHLRNQTDCGFCWDIGNCPTYPYVDVLVNPRPTLSSSTNPPSISSGSYFTYAPTSATTGTTFTWSRAAFAGIQQQASSGNELVNEVLTNTTSNPIDVTYLFSGTANGCPGPIASVIVTVNPIPNNYNYIITRDIQSNKKPDGSDITEADIASLPVHLKAENTTYFDGLGRPMQSVSTQGSPNKKDIVTPITYDDFSRENIKYLPYVSVGTDGFYKPSALTEQLSFYTNPPDGIPTDPRPFSETFFEPSPLNRPDKDFGAGQDWFANDRHVKHGYLVNVATEENVIAWNVDASGMPVGAAEAAGYVEPGGHYATGQLTIKKHQR